MTTPILEENIRRLFRRCVPRPDDADRAFARFEARQAPVPPLGRRFAAVAALAFVALALWLAVPHRNPAPLPVQEPRVEISKLIDDLGSETPSVRDAAEQRLRAIGSPALEELDRALYHQVADVRVRSKELARRIRKRLEIEPYVAFVRASVRIARKRWVARDFKDIEAMLHEAFSPSKEIGMVYVPKKTIDDRANMDVEGGVLTSEVAAALDAEPGIVFLDKGSIVNFGRRFLFTLPDKVGWSAYVVANFSESDPSTSPRISVAYFPSIEDWSAFGQILRLEPHPGGGAKVLTPLSFTSRGPVLEAGDVVRQLNGKPVGVDEVRTFFSAWPQGRHSLTIERGEKVYDACFRFPEIKPKK